MHQVYFMAFMLNENTNTYVSINGFMTACPKELFHLCGDINPWGKFFKS